MKKVLAILLLAVLVAMPVLAGFDEDANIGNVKYTIGKYFEKPVLDGKLDEYGYTKLPVAAGDISYAWTDDVDGTEAIAKGLSFDAYVSYDANNLYFLVRSDAKYYFNEYDDGDSGAWQGSGIQVSAARKDDAGGDRLEYGIWRKSNDGTLGAVIWSQHPEAKAEFAPAPGSNYTVVLDGGNLWYEGVVPINTFTDKDSVAEGDVIAFSIVIVQSKAGDEAGYIHTQIASGCTGNGKTAENFMRLTLGATIEGPPPAAPEPEPAPEPAAPAPAPEQPAPAPAAPAPAPAAPPTGDNGIFILGGLLLAAGVSVFIKKIAAK